MFIHDMKLKRRSQRARHRGQAIIEMALVVTILLFLTLGLIQYAMLANARITLTNLAREGARYAAVNALKTGSDNDIKDYVDLRVAEFTTLKDITRSDILLDFPEGRQSGKPVKVDVSYNMRNKFILPVSFPGLARFGTATATAVMVIE